MERGTPIMAKELHMIFLNEEGRKRTIKPKAVREDVTAAVVQNAMEQIVDLDLFEKDDMALYKEVKGAKFVETIVTELF